MNSKFRSVVLLAFMFALAVAVAGCVGDASSQTIDGVIAHDGQHGGSKRSQIIAAVETREPYEVRSLAIDLADLYGFDNVLVNFYSDPAVISRFDGSGLMLDEKSWIGEVVIDSSTGRLKFTPSPFTD